jgi:hypothetical protein
MFLCVNGRKRRTAWIGSKATGMNAAGKTASLAVLLILASGQASATVETRPLQLDLTAPALRPFPATPSPRTGNAVASVPERAPALAGAFRRQARAGARADAREGLRPEPRPGTRAEMLRARTHDLGERALENVLDPQVPRALDEERSSDGRMQLKFQKRSNAFRDLNRSYREMCDRVSEKIWDDPNGKRVRFDVAGKPGIAFEIPVGHHNRR